MLLCVVTGAFSVCSSPEDKRGRKMARPNSEGVGYFPKDVGFYRDDKIKLLRAEFGAKGMYLLDYILCELYEKDGYFMKWDERKCYLVSDGAGCGCNPSFVEEVVVGSVRCEVFDKRVFDEYGVLTSAGIQRRFVRMLKGREYVRLIKEYFVLDVNDKKDVPPGVLDKCAFFSVNGEENPEKCAGNPEKCAGNDTKESKVNKSKEKESKSNEREYARAETEKKSFGCFENVRMSAEDHGHLVEAFGETVASELIDNLSRKLKSKGYKYEDHYATILVWAKKDGIKPLAAASEGSSFDTDEFFAAALARGRR